MAFLFHTQNHFCQPLLQWFQATDFSPVERILGESEQNTRFPHPGVTDEEQFEEIVVGLGHRMVLAMWLGTWKVLESGSSGTTFAIGERLKSASGDAQIHKSIGGKN